MTAQPVPPHGQRPTYVLSIPPDAMDCLALDDIAACAVLVLALGNPSGITVAAAAAALGRPEAWVRWQVGADQTSPTMTAVPDLRTGATRYRYTHPTITDTALLAGALLALAEHDWAQGEHQDDLGRVDITGALRQAAGVHPEDTPDDPAVLTALLAAQDTLAAALGHDPTQVDAGETIAAWQDDPTRTIDEIRDLLTDVILRAGR